MGAGFQSVPVTEADCADHFADAVWHAEGVLANAHGVARFLLSRAIRRAGYKTVLAGEGADELFAGYGFCRSALLRGSGGRRSGWYRLAALLRPHNRAERQVARTSPWLVRASRMLQLQPLVLAALGDKLDVLRGMLAPDFLKRFGERDPYRVFFGGFDYRTQLAGREPFVAQMMPPCVTIRVDDGRGRHDFRYTEVMNRHGYRPMISCFLDLVPDDVAPFMRERYRAGQVEWDAHAFDYYKLIPFDFGIGEYSDGELKEIFGRVDRWYDERGLRPPRRAAFHWGEVGVRVLPYLKARGRTFVYSTFHLGQVKWERLFPNWWPYGLNSLFYDYIPEDPEMYNIGAMLPRHLVEPDVLTGCTTWAGDNPINDMDKAADRAAGSVRLALDSGFFSEITTHEQKFGVLTLEEIDRWLSLVAKRTDRFDIRGVSHDEAAVYTRARDESWIAAASTPDGRAVCLTLGGKASVDLELAVFENDGDGVVQRWESVPAFEDEIRIDL